MSSHDRGAPRGRDDGGRPPEDSAGHGSGSRDADVDWTIVAAVDGLGALPDAELDRLDMAEVARLESAAGALFAAVELDGRARGAARPPRGMLDRLNRAADLYVASHLSQNGAGGSMDRALGVSDAATHRSQADSANGVQGRHGEETTRRASSPSEFGRRSDVVHGESEADRGGDGSGFGALAAFAGWAAAAALLVGLLFSMDRVAQLKEGAVSMAPDEELARLELVAPDVQTLSWLPLGGASAPKGSVVWSNERNQGFMRIQGLPVNDPSLKQYQLWIFRGTDPGAEPHPVDGGVFDVASTGEVIIPIDAKIRVGEAGTFAVTVEKPGGVVVSKREQIVLLAQRA
ncbi:MAG: anti-sigma factor [Planctomycetota bacterium]